MTRIPKTQKLLCADVTEEWNTKVGKPDRETGRQCIDVEEYYQFLRCNTDVTDSTVSPNWAPVKIIPEATSELLDKGIYHGLRWNVFDGCNKAAKHLSEGWSAEDVNSGSECKAPPDIHEVCTEGGKNYPYEAYCKKPPESGLVPTAVDNGTIFQKACLNKRVVSNAMRFHTLNAVEFDSLKKGKQDFGDVVVRGSGNAREWYASEDHRARWDQRYEEGIASSDGLVTKTNATIA